MKTRLFSIVAILLSFVLITGCKSSQQTVKPVKAHEQDIPLSGKKYRSDKEYWRVVQQGVSPDVSMAKKVALQNARGEMSATIKAQVKAVIDNYGKNFAVAGDISVVNAYEEQAYAVIDQTLVSAEMIDEKLYSLSDGTYRYHVCLQVARKSIADQLEQAFMKDARLRASFDKEQFKKVYDEQMNAQ